MAVFLWEGKTREGTSKTGEMVADSQDLVMTRLRQQRIMPSKVKKKPIDIGEFLTDKIPFLKTKVTERDLVVFVRQFATMIDAGLPLVQCLAILSGQQPNKNFASIISAVKDDVEGGSTFADALKKHPETFDHLFSNLVAAGEAGGVLDVILNRLAMYIEKAKQLKGKVKGAMYYPLTVFVVAIGVVIIILWKVIPTFEKMFSTFGGNLPGITQAVINLSHFVVANLHWIGLSIFGVIFGFRTIYRTKKGKLIIDGLALKAPLVGPLIRKVSVARFTRTLGTMISSGVPILEGLEITAKTAGNQIVANAIENVKGHISEGKTIAEPLGECGIFPSMVVQMVGVGEQTGALDTMLNKIADFYEDEVDTAVEGLTSMLEPIMIVFLGGAVGTLLVSMYLPIFSMAGAMSGSH